MKRYSVCFVGYFILQFVVHLVVSTTAQAAIEKYHGQLTTIMLPENTNPPLIVVDDKLLNTPLPPDPRKVTDRITLSLDEAIYATQQTAFSVTVSVTIKSYTINNQLLNTISTNLKITYNPASGSSYTDQNVYQFSGGHKFEARITSIIGIPSTQNLPLTYLHLEGEIEVERYYNFDDTAVPEVSFNGPYTTDNPSDQLEVTWEYLPGAEEYDLEWTYLDDYQKPFINFRRINEGTFRNSSSRVTLTSNSYRIPLLYEQGYILFRVRGVGVGTDFKSRIPGKWSSEKSPPYDRLFLFSESYHLLNGHSDLLNWQVTTTYAEEGKRKISISYFDGTLRNRQAVSEINTINRAIVGETIYDYQGRAAIQVLPVPTAESAIRFYTGGGLNEFGFNRNKDKQPFTRKNFDTDPTSCFVNPEPMDSSSGAANYYSSSNTEKDGAQAYLPRAFGYPYTQTEYTPDNRGLIRSQSGVGADHKLGSGRETKYFYGNPSQEELDRLFGSEVGHSVFYKKNMVQDANKQLSVSYLDAKGKVIATALAGVSPQNLDSLSSNPPGVSVPRDLLTTNKIDSITTNALIALNEILVSSAGPHKFHYDVAAATFTNPACLGNSICYDCVYDMVLSVTDECGNEMMPNGVPQRTTIGKINPPDTACDNPPLTFTLTPDPVEITLPVGTYTVSKSLTVNTQALAYYTTKYFENNSCLKTLPDFVNPELAKIDTTDCNITCSACNSTLDDCSDIPAGDAHEIECEAAKRECNDLCDAANLCKTMYQMLLSDVSPGGQYAQYKTTSGTDDPSQFPLSVLNESNVLPKNFNSGTATWRHPNGEYKDEYGNTSLIKVENNFPTVKEYETINAQGYIRPEQLKYVTDFIKLWKPSWAKALVSYHPEYCYYEQCKKYDEVIPSGATQTSDDFDYQLLTKDTTYQVALVDGLVNNILLKDPYFMVGGEGASYKTWIDISQLKKIAVQTIRCGTMYGITSFPAECDDVSDFCTGTTDDDEWLIFRSLYLAEKQKIQQLQMNEYAKEVKCYNGCFGDINYSPLRDGMIKFGSNPFIDFTYGFFDELQPCYYENFWRYSNKIKRFRNANDIINLGVDVNGDPMAVIEALKTKADFELYKTTGQCPLARDMEFLLGALVKAQKITTTVSLVGYPQFTESLYREITNTTSFVSYSWKPTLSADNRTMTVQFMDGTTPDDCVLEIAFPQGGAYNWTSAIVGINRLKFLQYQSPNYLFEVRAMISNASEPNSLPVSVTLKGKTSIKVGNCTFPDECPPTKEAIDLQAFMNGIIQTGKFTNTMGVSMNPPFSSLDKYLGTGTWSWSQLSNGIFKIDGGMLNTITISFTNTAFAFNSISSFSSINRNPAYPNDKDRFIITAKLNNSTYQKLEGRVSLFAGALFPVVKCSPPKPIECTSVEHQVREELQAFLNAMATNGTLTTGTPGVKISTMPEYTTLLTSHADSSLWISESTEDGDSLMVSFVRDSLTRCNLQLAFINSSPSFTLSQIQRFSNLIADETNLTGGKAFSFWITAERGNSKEFLYGTSCFPLKNCDVCSVVETCTVSNSVGNSEFDNDYDDFVTSFYKSAEARLDLPSGKSIIDSNAGRYLTWTGKGRSPNNPFFLFRVHPNRQPESSNIVWQQTIQVSPQTTYTFGYWGLNPASSKTLQPCPPNLILKINNQIVSSDSFSYAPNKWKNISATWTSDTNRTAVITLVTNTYGTTHCGLGIDDITFVLTEKLPDATPCLRIVYLPPGAPCVQDSTLITNRQFEAGNTGGFTSDYTYSTSSTLQRGRYTIGTDANDYNDNWTGSGHGGKFFIARLKTTGGQMKENELWKKTLSVKPFTDYIFSFWALNLNDSTMPGCAIPVVASINDSTVQPSATLFLPVAPNDWKQVSVPWNSGTQTSVTLRIASPASPDSTQECGIGLDDFLFLEKCCGPDTGFAQVEFPKIEYKNPCPDHLRDIAGHNGEVKYKAYIDSVTIAFQREYIAKCLTAAESLSVHYVNKEYHYTLYYYDQSGNLVKTVPPAGVKPLTTDNDLENVKLFRDGGYKKTSLARFPSHTLVTQYRYNSLNQVKKQLSPDADSTEFWYDRLGRLAVSQNGNQRAKSILKSFVYSYTRYDDVLGRIIEVGQIKQEEKEKEKDKKMDDLLVRDTDKLISWIKVGTKDQVTKTFYDTYLSATINTMFGTGGQQSLRSRVATMSYQDVYTLSNIIYNHATHYSYDIHGNVKTLIQENQLLNKSSGMAGQGTKRMTYDYDLISGKVNEVHYQSGKMDQFHHRYEYDADNRITAVYTSSDSIIWDNDARYFYYLHGPLARVELGDQNVQGMDYAYTIQGWLKGVNSATLVPFRDIGKDGKAANIPINYIKSKPELHRGFAQDVFGFSLGYFDGDYSAIASQSNETSFLSSFDGTAINQTAPSLYNGNISTMVTAIEPFMKNATPFAYGFRYDQLNRLLKATQVTGFNAHTNKWDNMTASDDLYMGLSYDPNGNIMKMLRNGNNAAGGPLEMDSLTYAYYSGTNRLNYVHDKIDKAYYPANTTADHPLNILDLDNQNANNYGYDANGNLVKDDAEEIAKIEWTVYGKLSAITRSAGSTKPALAFRYDAGGNRIAKIVSEKIANKTKVTTTYYVRDASGNIMATYQRVEGQTGKGLWLKEFDLYGSSRLGIVDTTIDMLFKVSKTPPSNFTRLLGKKRYELTNHLGNVQATVSDRKLMKQTKTMRAADDFEECSNRDDTHRRSGEYASKLGANGFSCSLSEPVETGDVITASIWATYETGPPHGLLVVGLLDANNQYARDVNGAEQWIPANFTASAEGEWAHYTITYTVPALQTTYNGLHIVIYGWNPPASTSPVWVDDLTVTVTHNDALKNNYITADIISATDYYPFGMEMPGRKYSTPNYRFGYNGMEKDDEIKGNGNHFSFGDYGYDPRLVRRWNMDPMVHEMTPISPYVAFFNNPIIIQDPKGEFGFAGFLLGFTVDVGVQMLANGLAGKPITDIDYGDAFISGLVGMATGGLGNVGKLGTAAQKLLTAAKIEGKVASTTMKISAVITQEGIKASVDIKIATEDGEYVTIKTVLAEGEFASGIPGVKVSEKGGAEATTDLVIGSSLEVFKGGVTSVFKTITTTSLKKEEKELFKKVKRTATGSKNNLEYKANLEVIGTDIKINETISKYVGGAAKGITKKQVKKELD